MTTDTRPNQSNNHPPTCNMTMLEIMQRDCPHAIKDVLVMPDGVRIPVIGKIWDDGSHDIDPAALDLLQRAGTT